MEEKLHEASKSNNSTRPKSLTKAIAYVNSDLVSKLRYRMYLIAFPKTYLNKFETSIVQTVKRLARLPNFTPTDLLISQGLQNFHLLQDITRSDFLQTALQAPNMACRHTSQLSYS